jgi:hypothetical protein
MQGYGTYCVPTLITYGSNIYDKIRIYINPGRINQLISTNTAIADYRGEGLTRLNKAKNNL